MSEDYTEDDTENLIELDADKIKFSTWRVTPEVYEKLKAKRARGEKINFKERGSDYQFGTKGRAPAIEVIALQCGAGCYLIEHLYEGIAVDHSFIVVEPDEKKISLEEKPAPVQTAAPLPVQEIPQAAPAIDYDKLAASVAEKLKPAAVAPAPAVSPVVDILTQMKALREFEISMRPAQTESVAEIVRREVQALREDLTQEREPEDTDTDTKVLMTVLKDTGIRDRLSNGLSKWIDPDSAPEKHWAVELGAMVMDNTDKLPAIVSAGASLLGTVVGLFKGKPQMPQPPMQYAQQPQPPAPPVETQPTFAQEADSVFSLGLESCRDDAPTRKAARSVGWLIDTYPEETQGIVGILQLPGASLCQMLAAQMPHAEAQRILNLPHSPAWFEKLKAAIAKRREGSAEAAPPIVSNNGNRAEAATVQAS